MRILQINSVANSGSTGRIAEDIGKVLIEQGHESYIAYGRYSNPSRSQLIRIGNKVDVYSHGLVSLLLDRHGFASKKATIDFIKKIDALKPDAIGLHNIHGYYLNIDILFKYLSKSQIPVLWAFYDCWNFTGHCSYFDKIGCDKWKTGCYQCGLKHTYPTSLFVDNAKKNYEDKKRLFNSVDNIQLVVPSKWLEGLVRNSYLSDLPVHTIHTGIDMDVFKPNMIDVRRKYNIQGQKVVLGCANIWNARKGLADFISLRNQLDKKYDIVLVGLSRKQIGQLPDGIKGIERTENVAELAALYSMADVFVNPTWADNFPTTNIEALACGTPVITYDTGGGPESIDENTGYIVEKNHKEKLADAVLSILTNDREKYKERCVLRAQSLFDKQNRYNDYINLYKNMIG
ncbi:MAG: glycosyltransferase [Dysgonomonas sp.]